MKGVFQILHPTKEDLTEDLFFYLMLIYLSLIMLRVYLTTAASLWNFQAENVANFLLTLL